MKCVFLEPAKTVSSNEVTLYYSGNVDDVVNEFIDFKRTEKEFDKLVKNLNGCFYICAFFNEHAYLAVDRMATKKLFFVQDGDIIYVSEHTENFKKLKLTSDERTINIYRNTTFSTNNSTLWAGVCQLLAGQYLRISLANGSLEYVDYFSYSSQKHIPYSFDEFKDDILHISKRFKLIHDKDTIYIPLSTGADSLLVSCVVKLAGINNVVCFTYGRNYAREVSGSKAIAESFGYKWKFVEYNNKLWKEFRKSGELDSFCDYAGEGAESIHVQDFLAVQELIKEYGDKDRAHLVFVPGHTGVIGGGNLKSQVFCKDTYGASDRFEIYSKKDYDICGKGKKIVKTDDILLTHINSDLCDLQTEVSFYQKWDMRERQAKGIISSLKVYEYFGCSWDLVLNDTSLMEHLYQMPLQCRFDKKTYKQYCKQLYKEITGISIPESVPREGITKIASNIIHPFHAALLRVTQLWTHELGWFAIMTPWEKTKYIVKNQKTIGAFLSEYYINHLKRL